MGGRKAKNTVRERERIRDLQDAERVILAGLSSFGDPLAVVHAIVSSPLGIHRYLSMAPAVRVAIRAAAQQRPLPGPSGGMNEVVHFSSLRAGTLPHLEDAIPIDPRIEAVGVFKNRPYRLFPGMLERPVATLRTAELVCDVVDPTLLQELGFRASDYVELCLSHTHHVVTVLAPSWSNRPLPRIGDLPSVTGAEVASAASSAVNWHLPTTATEQHHNALAWATTTLGRLRPDTDQGMAGTCFGSSLAVSGPDKARLALPLPYVAEAWDYTVTKLAQRAARKNPECERRWLAVARKETTRLLLSLPDLPDSRIVHGPAGPVLLVLFGARHILAFAVAAGITSCDIRPAEAALAAITPGIRVHTQSGSLDIDADAEIVRVAVAAPIGPAMLFGGHDAALVTLSDLQWMTSTCPSSHELWGYLHEDVFGHDDTRILGWDAADSWQFWKSNAQAIHRAGLPPTTIAMAPHQVGAEECETAAVRGSLEFALLRLRLPPSRELRALVHGRKGPTTFWTPDYRPWALALLEPGQPRTGTILAEVFDGDIPAELDAFATSLLGTVCRVGQHDPSTTSAALRECRLDKCVVRLRFDPEGGEPLRLGTVNESIELVWNNDLPRSEAEHPGYIQEQLVRLLLDALSCNPTAGTAVRALSERLPTVPRMIVVSAETVPQRAHHIPRPTPIPDWAVSQANRRLGAHLREVGCEVGRRDRPASRNLELSVVVPWLKNEIADQFSRFNSNTIIRRAAADVEAISNARFRERQQRRNRANLPTTAELDEELDSASDADTRLARHWSVSAALLELGMTAAQDGTRHPDDVDWHHLMSSAGLFVDSTVRCDALLHELSNNITEVSDSYEITLETDDDSTPTAIDVEAFNNARIQHARRDTAGALPVVPEPDAEAILAEIDPAMLQDLGCTATTLVSTCSALASWPVTNDKPIAETSIDELCYYVTTQFDLEPAEIRAAITELTLTRDGLVKESVQPWKGRSRDYRLMARPIVALSDDTVLVLPWTAGTSAAVLTNYLSDGLLPWPQSRLDNSRQLRKALDRVRLQRTKVLEDQVDAELRRLGFVVRSRIKPQHARTIGLPSLPGEIDHLAVHRDEGVLWVIDDKDLTEVYTPAETARGVSQFYDPRKGEIPKLQAKVNTIVAHLDAVAGALGIATPSSVRPMFVSRNPIPAAFATNPPALFTTLIDLRDIVGPPANSGDDTV